MGWFILAHIFSTILSLVQVRRLSEKDKDLEIIILRHQLAVMTRLHAKPVKPNRVEKMTLAIMTKKLKQSTHRSAKQLRDVIRVIQPDTVLRWYRELARRKWTYPQRNKGGRPKIHQEKETMIVCLAKENLRWGYGKIEGELIKLGYRVSLTTIRNVLDRNGIVPAPVRYGSIGWKTMINHYKEQLLACDFFTIETVFLRTVYVLVFIEIGSRRVHLAGITSHPDGRWVAQQARQIDWQIDESETNFRCLIRDNDSKYTEAFANVFESQQTRIIPTPLRAPNANTYMERWIRSVREECLDHILVINEAHLRRVLNEYLSYYNQRRPHQGLDQQSPIPRPEPVRTGRINRRQVLGGIINDYFRSPDKSAVCPT